MADTSVAERTSGVVTHREPRQGISSHWRRLARRVAFAAIAVIVLAAATQYGLYYWNTGRFLVSTDDAYVQADSVIISPKVSGYISQVLVRDNQQVSSGEVLARIDDRDYRTALAGAQANVAAAIASIDNLQQEIGAQTLAVEQAQQAVVADRAAAQFAQQDYQRYAVLSHNGAGSTQEAQQSAANIQEKQAALQRDITGVALARKQIDVLQAQLAKARATQAQLEAAQHQAELNLSYTVITSPIDGSVGVRTLRVGQYVQAGTQLMALVPLQAVYVVANYKETQLTNVRPGEPASVSIDTFPGKVVHGHVDSLAPASGDEFALLPPDNATGNFTKIVQRIPVKIVFNPNDPLAGLLRPGMSVEPVIDTRLRAVVH